MHLRQKEVFFTEKVTKNPKTPGERLKQLRMEYEDNDTQRGKMTQFDLAEKVAELQTGSRKCSEKQIGYQERNERDISPDYAMLFAKVFGVRYEYILCLDDFRTDAERFDALIERSNSLYSRKIDALKTLAGLRGIEIALYSSGMIQSDDGRHEDVFLVRNKEGKQTFVAYSEICEWIEDISDFTELKLKRHIVKGDSSNG